MSRLRKQGFPRLTKACCSVGLISRLPKQSTVMAAPSTHQVFRHTDRSSHHTLQVSQEAVPAINPHEVLVKIRGVALNYRDLVIANSLYPAPIKDNVVPCSDGAGVVVSVGSAVSGFKVGDRVVANFDVKHMYGPLLDMTNGQGGAIDGTLRQYVAYSAASLVKIPEECELSFVELSTLVCAGLTAWNALFGNAQLKPGQTVLFLGTGGVSIMGLQIAKAAGAVTIITSSSDEKLKFVQEKYGADHVINYKTTPDWAAEVSKITKGRGVDFVLETGGSGTLEQSIAATAPGGSVAIIGILANAKQEEMPNVAALVMGKGVIVRGILIGSIQLMEEFVRFITVKKIVPPVNKVFGFTRDEVIAAFDLIESGAHIGKICIQVE